ncbi:TetR/AcrR family transcriptional regulator [Paenarthrobacter ureafaciens]|nr:TetR/AcrR family transcriptional regulator [Paenarthrobacter ureafaciens]
MTLLSQPSGQRLDLQRNRTLLVDAAGRLFGAGRSATMSEIAAEAGISSATAYRHFASVDDVLAAYRFEVGRELLAFSQNHQAQGLELLDAVCSKWVQFVVRHGESMIHTRSAEGYLARVKAGAYYLTVQAEALRKPLREAAEALGIEDPGDEALFLWNGFFDPREIHDLLRSLDLDEAEVSARLVATFTAALTGWSSSRT